MIVEGQLLKDGILELQARGKISIDLKNDMYTFIDNLSSIYINEIGYKDFDQTNSVNVTFTDSSRTASFIGDGSTIAELITNKIELTNIILKGIKLKATDQNVIYEISNNLVNWYSIEDFDIDETITADFYIKIKITETNSITGFLLIYETVT